MPRASMGVCMGGTHPLKKVAFVICLSVSFIKSDKIKLPWFILGH